MLELSFSIGYSNPRRNYLDLTKDTDEIDDAHDEDEVGPDIDGEMEREPEQRGAEPLRRVRQKTANYKQAEEAHERPKPVEHDAEIPAEEPPPAAREDEIPEGLPWQPEPADEAVDAPEASMPQDNKRELDGGEQPPEKRTRVELLEVYHAQLQALARQRQRKEATAKDFQGRDAMRLQRAILKEVNNNLQTGAYRLLSLKESEQILKEKPDKVMESRYVLTKKSLEPADVAQAQAEDLLLEDRDHGPHKAKCRHVMKGFSEQAAVEVECTTPQVSRDSVIFVTQVLASVGWTPGFLDFTQAFHSGDQIDRELYCSQPREGVPGAHPRQLLKLLKTCYGLTDGPLAWYKHLARRLVQDFGYKASMADPCVFLKQEIHGTGSSTLRGIIGVATDDLLHGGDSEHWAVIDKIAQEYKLGKNQVGFGRFTGKDIKLEEDGSITISQAFYVEEKVPKIKLAKSRKQQRYSKCTAQEIEQLRSQLGALSWLAKETRCDLAGRVSLLQQSFPEPRVADLIEGNRIAEEAVKHKELGIKVMPIPWKNLRVSVVTDAAWGNTKEFIWIEDHPDDVWEEHPDRWIRYHNHPRRTSFHPGAAPGGPDLHELQAGRVTKLWVNDEGQEINYQTVEDEWCDSKGVRVLSEKPWTGMSVFMKGQGKQAVPATKVHSSLVQLQNLSSQGGQIIIYHDAALVDSQEPSSTTVAAWKSFRLKRKVVDTLAAEGQALQAGIGSVHWHRLLFLEAFYGMMSAEDWRREAQKLPFIAAVDSKSLFDAANKLSSPTAYVSDKRTAIDLSVIKADILETAGKIRWIDTRAMIADPLTKVHQGDYLRYVMSTGLWSVVEEGVALQRKALERQGSSAIPMFFLSVWGTQSVTGVE